VTGARRLDLAGPDAGAAALSELVAAARLVCFPTDTVYGVGGVVTPAVRDEVIAAKGREAGKPLQVIYPTVELLEASLALGPRLLGAARRLLPGPFTLLLPYPPELRFPPAGEVVRAAHERQDGEATTTASLGVRVPAWPAAARALSSLPFPLLASSANPSGGAWRILRRGTVDERGVAALLAGDGEESPSP